jgi:hypothetical protein
MNSLSLSYLQLAISPHFCSIIELAVTIGDAHFSAILKLFQVIELVHYCSEIYRKIMSGVLVFHRKRSEYFGVECLMNWFLESSVCADYLYEIG